MTRKRTGRLTPTEKPKNFKKAMSQLIAYIGKYKAAIAATCLIAIISTAMTVIGPLILGGATDELVSGIRAQLAGTGTVNFERIAFILIALTVLQTAAAGLSYLQGFIMAGISVKITYAMRRQLSEKIHRLPFKYFDKNTHGDVLSRITNDIDTITNTLNQGITQLVTSFASVIGIAIMMFIISPILMVVSLAILPLSGFFIGIIMKKSQKHFTAQAENTGKLNGHIEEMLGAHEIVKSYGAEARALDEFDKHNNELYQASWRANFMSGLMWPIIEFIGNLNYVAICILGGIFAAAGTMTVGGIQAFIQYTRRFGEPLSQIATVAGVLQQTAAAAERIFNFLAEEEEPPEVAQPVSFNKIKGQVSFENVSFGYNADEPIIHSFTAHAKKGQKIAIVGHTGAGKTTLVKLLMRFYDVDAGSISIDGTDIRLYTREGLRGGFGMVLQDTWLFNGTIADNIRYGNLSATDAQIKKAAKAAQADYFIRALPEGYNMEINEEADNISAGQKQLLAIARTILANPQILILDEATSNIDTRTELLIQKAMDNLMKGRTSFIIAHRLSTIRSADIILVMQDGDIVEQGSHEELLDRGGVYAGLYNSQFEDVA